MSSSALGNALLSNPRAAAELIAQLMRSGSLPVSVSDPLALKQPPPSAFLEASAGGQPLPTPITPTQSTTPVLSFPATNAGAGAGAGAGHMGGGALGLGLGSGVGLGQIPVAVSHAPTPQISPPALRPANSPASSSGGTVSNPSVMSPTQLPMSLPLHNHNLVSNSSSGVFFPAPVSGGAPQPDYSETTARMQDIYRLLAIHQLQASTLGSIPLPAATSPSAPLTFPSQPSLFDPSALMQQLSPLQMAAMAASGCGFGGFGGLLGLRSCGGAPFFPQGPPGLLSPIATSVGAPSAMGAFNGFGPMGGLGFPSLAALEDDQQDLEDDPRVELVDKDLWDRFHRIGTEMVRVRHATRHSASCHSLLHSHVPLLSDLCPN